MSRIIRHAAQVPRETRARAEHHRSLLGVTLPARRAIPAPKLAPKAADLLQQQKWMQRILASFGKGEMQALAHGGFRLMMLVSDADAGLQPAKFRPATRSAAALEREDFLRRRREQVEKSFCSRFMAHVTAQLKSRGESERQTVPIGPFFVKASPIPGGGFVIGVEMAPIGSRSEDVIRELRTALADYGRSNDGTVVTHRLNIAASLAAAARRRAA